MLKVNAYFAKLIIMEILVVSLLFVLIGMIFVINVYIEQITGINIAEKIRERLKRK